MLIIGKLVKVENAQELFNKEEWLIQLKKGHVGVQSGNLERLYFFNANREFCADSPVMRNDGTHLIRDRITSSAFNNKDTQLYPRSNKRRFWILRGHAIDNKNYRDIIQSVQGNLFLNIEDYPFKKFAAKNREFNEELL